MAYNLGSVGAGGYSLGYTGLYTGGTPYPYILTSHGAADPNSVLANANFATTGDVDLRVVSDFDPAKVTLDWQAISDGQLWREDISTLTAVIVAATADTTDTATIGWRTPDGTEGQFTVTVSIALPDTGNWPFPIDTPSIPITWEWGGRHPKTGARVRLFKRGQ